MALQQMDLFGNFSPEPDSIKEKGKKVEKPVFAPTMLELFPLEVLDSAAVITEEKKLEEAVVFNDGKIRVRIKPKAVIKEEPREQQKEVTPQTPAPETGGYIPEPIMDKEGIARKGRGRRSYKEIDATADLIDIPDDETLNQKLYYSIGEVAGWFKVNTSQIRFWENEFDILKPRKNRKGDRLFRVEDIKNLQVIYYLLRNRKFSIEGAREYLKANKHKTNVNIQLVHSLTMFKSFLLELKANLGE